MTLLLLIIICLGIYWCISSKELLSELPFKESIYFQVTDSRGTDSIIHDSGQNPVLRELRFNILKREINNRSATVLMTPKAIKYGFHPSALNSMIQVRPEDIEDKGDHYLVRARRTQD